MQHRKSPLYQAVWGLAAAGLLTMGLAGCGGSTPAPLPGQVIVQNFLLSTVTNGSLPVATADAPYSYGFLTNIGDPGVSAKGPVSFHPMNALPPGLSLSSEGQLTGTPNQAGFFSFNIQAIDSTTPTPLTASHFYNLQVNLPAATLTQVAHLDLGGHGQNASVRVATASATGVAYAYVGTRGTPGECPADGVKIVDLSSITHPLLVATAGAVAGAAQTQMRIATGISSPNFHSGGSGDLLALTEQPCDPAQSGAAQAGVEFYDVTDPTHPQMLGSWSSGLDGAGDVALLPEPAQGKIYALVAVPGSETSSAGTGLGDLRVLDVTDPANPQAIGDWGVLKATGATLADVVMGMDPRVFLSNIELSSDGKTAYLGYWDDGVVVLNVSDPTQIHDSNPAIISDHITYPITAGATTSTPALPEGNTRQALPMVNDSELLIADQVCASAMASNPDNPAQQTPTNPAVDLVCGPGSAVPLSLNEGWGFVRTYALESGSSATLEGFFATPQSMAAPAPDNGIYTAHALAWNGDGNHPHAYVAWYSAGVQDLDISSIAPPTLLATFVPPDTPDPNGNNPAVNNPAKAMVDGVAAYTANGAHYILASDINSGLWIVQEIPAPRLTLLTTTLPDANLFVPYNAQLAAINGAAGSSRMTFSLGAGSNSMPAGLILGSDGAITGTPLAAGTGPVTFEVSDGAGHSAEQTITLTVDQKLAILPPVVPLGATGAGYSLQLSGANGTTPYQWSVVRGSLPPGFTINATTGLITGTSSAAGSYSATVQLTDSTVPQATATLPLTITLAGLTPENTSLPDAQLNQAYAQSVTMLNGTGPFTVQLASGTLPPGLALASSPSLVTDWLLSGTPTQAGAFAFSVRITDANGASTVVPMALTVDPIALSPSTLPPGVAGQGYLQTLSVLGAAGSSPQLSVVLGSLPPGLTLSRDGTLTGVPAAGSAGDYSFQVFAQISGGASAKQDYVLTIFNPGALAITTLNLPGGVAGRQYSAPITADFGAMPYAFQLVSGSLPGGVTLDRNGTLEGVPSAISVGSYTFVVQVTDSTGATAKRQLTWIIAPAPVGGN